MRERTLVLALPGAAMAVVAFAWLGPGAARPFEAAQVWGGKIGGNVHASWRVAIVERLHGIDSEGHTQRLAVDVAASNGARGAWAGPVGPHGFADVEVLFDRPPSGEMFVSLRGADPPRTLGAGLLQEPTTWRGGPAASSVVAGRTTGGLTVRVCSDRGVLAAPFTERMWLVIERAGSPVPNARVVVHVQGGSVEEVPLESASHGENAKTAPGMVTLITSAVGRASFRLTPETHSVSATVHVRAGEEEGSWSGDLRIVPGAMWVDADGLRGGVLRVISPVPREEAYVSVARADRREWGATLHLTPREDPTPSASVPFPIERGGERAFVTLSSDPRGGGSGTVGFALVTPEEPCLAESRAFRDVLLYDGLPYVQRVQHLRVHRARLLAGSALLAAALLEVLLLVRGVQRAEGAFQAGIERCGPDAGSLAQKSARPSAIVRLGVALFVVMFAFAAVGVVVLWKTAD